MAQLLSVLEVCSFGVREHFLTFEEFIAEIVAIACRSMLRLHIWCIFRLLLLLLSLDLRVAGLNEQVPYHDISLVRSDNDVEVALIVFRSRDELNHSYHSEVLAGQCQPFITQFYARIVILLSWTGASRLTIHWVSSRSYALVLLFVLWLLAYMTRLRIVCRCLELIRHVDSTSISCSCCHELRVAKVP